MSVARCACASAASSGKRNDTVSAANETGGDVGEVRLQSIGTVRNGRDSRDDADWGALESTIELAPGYAAGLAGLSASGIVAAWGVLLVSWMEAP